MFEKNLQYSAGEENVQRVIEQVDEISQLIDDCLLDVLSRLDHNDLDEAALLSRRLCILSDLSRPRAVKIETYKLDVRQESDLEFRFFVIYEEQRYVLRSSGSGLFTKLCEEKKEEITTWKGQTSLSQARSLVSRFDFKECHFFNAPIDHNFLNFLEQISYSRSLININLFNSTFCDNLGGHGRERFLSLIISAKPTWIQLHLDDEAPFIDKQFLETYIQVVPHQRVFYARSSNENRSPLRVSKLFTMETLSNFAGLSMPRLFVDTDLLLCAFMKRFRQKRKGNWWFRVTRNITLGEIEAAMGADMKYHLTSDGHVFTFDAGDHKVTFRVYKEPLSHIASSRHYNMIMFTASFRDL